MRRIAGAVAVVLATGVAAVPAQAHHSQDGKSGDANRAHGHHHGGKSHHRFFAIHGTVVSQTLAKNDDGTYSGDVVIAAKQSNRHARHGADDMNSGDDTTQEQKTFTLDHAKVKFHVTDRDPADGKVDEGDVVAGDRVLLAGKADRKHRRCDPNHANSEAESTTTNKISWAAFADPKGQATKDGAKRR